LFQDSLLIWRELGARRSLALTLERFAALEAAQDRPERAFRLAGAAAALRGMAQRDDQTRLLSEISSPALILVGAEDAITPVADSEKMHHAIAGSRLVVVENAGHVSNLERTEQFNKALLEFLRDSV